MSVIVVLAVVGVVAWTFIDPNNALVRGIERAVQKLRERRK